MTIATKTTLAPKAADAPGSVPPQSRQQTTYEFREPEIVQSRRCGLRILRWVCGCILAVWIILAVFTTGLMVLNRIRRHRIEGYCATGAVGGRRALEQKVTVDTDALSETIDNPNTSESGGIFAHDFVADVTGIYDRASKTCFVRARDERLLPPADYADLIEKSKNDYYAENILLCQELYRALQPPMTKTELSDLRSPLIYDLCSGVPTYRLEKIENRIKRTPKGLIPVVPDWRHVHSTWWDSANGIYIVKGPNTCFYKTKVVGIEKRTGPKTDEQVELESVENYQDMVQNYRVGRQVTPQEMFENDRLTNLYEFCYDKDSVYKMVPKRHNRETLRKKGVIVMEELIPGENGGKLLQMEIEVPGIAN